MDSNIRKYLSQIGRRGGKKSRRNLSAEDARMMVKVREARRAFIRFRVRCFWSFNPKINISKKDIPWVIDQLRRNGGRDAWEIAEKLCH